MGSLVSHGKRPELTAGRGAEGPVRLAGALDRVVDRQTTDTYAVWVCRGMFRFGAIWT
jgi:hypothetical protein